MVWLYRDFDFTPLFQVFTDRSNYIWITLALWAGVVANVMRSLRWRMLLRGAGMDISRWRAIELVFISYLINSVTPRLGELTRSVLVRRGDVDATAKALGTVVIEKVVDVLCLAIVVVAAIVARWEDTVGLVHRSALGLSAAVPSYVIFIVVGISVGLVVCFTLPRWSRIGQMLKNVWNGIVSVTRLEKPFGFWGLCATIWMCNFLQMWLLLPCFEELNPLQFEDALYLFAVGSVGVLLPTPGGAGPWHMAIVKCLTGLYRMPVEVAKVFALVTHGLKTALIILLGLLALLATCYEAWMTRDRKSQENTSRRMERDFSSGKSGRWIR